MATVIKNLWLFEEKKLLILKSLYECSKKNKLCGCDLVDGLSLKKNLLSYHIKVLKEKGYIQEMKAGRHCQYSLKKEKLSEIKRILSITGLVK